MAASRFRSCALLLLLAALHSYGIGVVVAALSDVQPLAASSSATAAASTSTAVQCSESPLTQHLSSQPYENYFYSDCHSAAQVVITSPLPDSNLTYIGPRLLVAWPAGNSGTVAYFAPKNGINGTLAIKLLGQQPLHPVYVPTNSSSPTGQPTVGVSMLLHFNSTAVLTIPIMGSIRTIRDFTEGPSILVPVIQNAINFSALDNGDGAMLARRWLDNETTTQMSFVPTSHGANVTVHNRTLVLAAGTYNFTSSFDYPQLTQLSVKEVLSPDSQGLATKQQDRVTSLAFLSYTEKLVAGAWRFLTYFGRDSMITLLLMQPVLSEGQGGAVEAVIAAVLERLNQTDGKVCHEETIGDYGTYLNLLQNISSTRPSCTYPMIDTDYYLPEVMANYFLHTAEGRRRRHAFFAQNATLDFGNKGLSYAHLAQLQGEKVMRSTAAFAAPGGQKQANLIHLEADQIVGEWRDSTYGIGGGRIPYDVNTGLVPAALRSIAALSAAGFYPSHPAWRKRASHAAKIWEDNTLRFFETRIPVSEAKALVKDYTQQAGYGFPSNAGNITSEVVFHGLSLNGYNDQKLVRVMNTDDCFRHYLLNTTNQTQLTAFINQTATNIRAPFPVGLSLNPGIVVANAAFGGNAVYAANWTNNAYHGTVIWGWPMAMMAAGLQRQLGRCQPSSSSSSKHHHHIPDFCHDKTVYSNALAAYHHLWDLIEANSAQLSQEVWSWQFRKGKFEFINFGALPPPPGLAPTESDIRQLWSLSFLAVGRDRSLGR